MKVLDKLEDLTFDPESANDGTLRGEQLLDKSLTQFGAARTIVVDKNGLVIGGNKLLQLAIEMGLGCRVVQSDGSRLVVVIRTDLDLETQPEARLLAYLDNRTSEVGYHLKPDQFAADVARGLDFGSMFTEAERLDALVGLATVDAEAAKLVPLKATLRFESEADLQCWLNATKAIAAGYPGETFAHKLTAWVEDQMTKLSGQGDGASE